MNEASLRSIAVEPDGSYAYVTGLQDLFDGAKTKFSIWRIKLVPGKGNSKVDDFSKVGRRIAVYDGNGQFPENASAKDRELMELPLLSLALLGDTLYATDALKGRVLLYDKQSGELKKEIAIPLACGIAVEPSGKIWVGHEHGKVSVLSPEGKVLATPIIDLKEVCALSFTEGKLYMADTEASQVRIYKVEGNDVSLEKTFGEAGRPGGDNQVQKEEITFAATPGNPAQWDWPMGGFTVDEKGWIWLASYGRRPPNPRQESAIWAIPPKGPNSLGNPVYDWNSAALVATDQAGPDALKIPKGGNFQWKIAGRSSSDGMICGLARTQKAGGPQDGGLHMGGNVLMGFYEESSAIPGRLRKADWSVILPKVAVGLAPIRGGKGGVLIGGDPWRGGVRHYTKDGLLIGGFHSDRRFGIQPVDWPSGLLDSHFGVNCDRDPRDGLLDVWTEDNFNQRLIWYRVDDRDIETFEGKFEVD